MKRGNWFKVYREAWDNPLVMKDSQHFAIWFTLLKLATVKPKKAIFKGKEITLQPGQLITGRQYLAGLFKDISESKVERILKTFEIGQQIEQQTSSQNRLISLKNWGKWQKSEQQTEQRVNNEWTTSEQRVNTHKNIREEKKYKEVEKSLSLRARARERARELESRFKFFKVKNFTKLIAAVEQNVNLDFARLVEKSEASDFLTGRNGKRNTDFSVEWLVCHSEDILSGAYDNPTEVKAPRSKSDASYDIDELERIK